MLELILITTAFCAILLFQIHCLNKHMRTDEDYEIESLSKGLIVLEALEGSLDEPLSLSRIIERTGFSRDFCTRSLRTLRLKGYAFQDSKGRWIIGKRVKRFAEEI